MTGRLWGVELQSPVFIVRNFLAYFEISGEDSTSSAADTGVFLLQ